MKAVRGVAGPAVVLVLLAAVSAAAVAFCQARGYTLYYGDAAAHLNIARRIVDSRTPGYDQVGTVWLPLPHALMLPLVRSAELWRNGLAGAIPVAGCFVLAGVFFYLAARRVYSSGAAAAAACALMALNPNLLYLQATPMTEPVLLASVAALLYFGVRFREDQSLASAAGAGVAVLAGTLTRYDAWFLLPFAAAYFAATAKQRRFAAAAVFTLIAGLGPLYWLAHNQWYYSDPLEFYRGQYSARAIYQRALDAGMARYPGDHEWAKAWLYFRTAVRWTAGQPLLWLGLAGSVIALGRRVFWPLALLALLPAFYILSMYSSGTPIFVPDLWPNSYYNSRYALAALPLVAFVAAALVLLAPARWRSIAAVLLVLAGCAPWFGYPRPDSWICWKESEVNSEARRAWTLEAARYLGPRYRAGDGVLTSFGDLTGIFQQAGIPLKETLHDGNQPQWLATLARPDLFLWEQWAVAISGDPVARAVGRLRRNSARYDCVKTIAIKGAPVIEIYRRREAVP